MSKTYSQLMKQIDQLQREAEDLRRKEVEGVVQRIRDAIEVYGLTAADLGLAAPRAGGRRAAVKVAARKAGGRKSKGAVVKYRDEAGHTWGGRGPRPAWLREALAAGRQLSDFAV